MNRKDMYVYGLDGYIYQKNANEMEARVGNRQDPLFVAPAIDAPYDDTFRFLKAVVRNQITLMPYDPNSLENNVMVVRILEAARKSAVKRKTIKL